MSPRPGRIAQEFAITLPRPRDVNSGDLVEPVMNITRALKGYLSEPVPE